MKLALVTCLLLAAGAVSAQPTFPRVDPSVQAARDTDRGVILAQERGEEVKALQAAEKALASAEPGEQDRLAATVERHRKNLIALDGEIRRAGGTAPAIVDATGPVRLRARVASTAPAAAPILKDAAPYWDVFNRREPSEQASDAAAASADAVPYWDVSRRKETQP